MKTPKEAAVFLDRDGTLNVEVNYLHRIEDFSWIPGVPAALFKLNQQGFRTIVVTNQAGVAHGLFPEEAVQHLHAFMQSSLYEAVGISIDAFYYCPYHPQGVVPPYRRSSPDRKPGNGMFLRAIKEWHIDPKQSFVIGDRNSDLAPGKQLGMTTLLVQTGYGIQEQETTQADHVARDLDAAVDYILSHSRHSYHK